MPRLSADWNWKPTKLGRGIHRFQKPAYRDISGRRLHIERLEGRLVLSTTWVVNTPLDVVNPTDGLRSLREAVEIDAISGDTITFNPSLASDSITLEFGEIQFGKGVTIDATMLSSGVTIHADADSRIFNIVDTTFGSAPPTVTLKGLTLTGGDIAESTPGNRDGQGGAIRSAGILTLENCNIHDNAATSGGGVYVVVDSAGSAPRVILDIKNSHINANTASLNGGGVGVHIASSGLVDKIKISESELSHNEAIGNGGALWIDAWNSNQSTELTAVTMDDNHALLGGSIYSWKSSLRTMESRITGSTATNQGSGIYAKATADSIVDIRDSEIAGNEGFQGGGIYTFLDSTSALNIADCLS